MTPFNVAIVKWIRLGFTFSGRSTRSDYWWPRLFVFVVNLVCLIVFLQGGGADWLQQFFEWSESNPTDFSGLALPPLSSLSLFALVFLCVFGLLTFIPDLAVSWRRFHDLGQPGWIHLLFVLASAFIPGVALAEYVWFALPGTKGSNRFGPDPRDNQPDIFT